MQTHLTARNLKGTAKPDKDVKVMLALKPNRKIVLFIHGFTGDAIKTWSDFHQLLPRCPTCQSRDLFFYGYDGLRADMTSSAALFRDFLHRLFGNTAQFLNENLSDTAKRPPDFAYDELVIVAHSLGAVITRRALLDATRLKEPWLGKTKLVLYAPAHKGASIADLALEVTSSFPFLRLFGVGARFLSPLIDQLRPGSADLEQLLKETKEARKGDANKHLVARRVIIAEYEKIVCNKTFADDPPPDTIPETDHLSVCKPTSDFRRPLEFLEECL